MLRNGAFARHDALHVNMVYASDQRFSSFVILVILLFGVRKGKHSNFLTENCFISQVPLFMIHIDSQHNLNLAPQYAYAFSSRVPV
jgi:hypothetical protein